MRSEKGKEGINFKEQILRQRMPEVWAESLTWVVSWAEQGQSWWVQRAARCAASVL